jgi:hypothetical protein
LKLTPFRLQNITLILTGLDQKETSEMYHTPIYLSLSLSAPHHIQGMLMRMYLTLFGHSTHQKTHIAEVS